jgi:phosphatidylserine/phosphatidylglycerophosphate/cardiolipin synthase-like enzyme
LHAADRGVRVRILIDDGETEDGDEQITSLQAHPLIQIRFFNPLPTVDTSPRFARSSLPLTPPGSIIGCITNCS